jgi:hypothetical protein
MKRNKPGFLGRVPRPMLLKLAPGLVALSILMGGCFRLSSETRAVRDAAMSSLAPAGSWDEQIEIGVGAITLGLVRSIAICGDLDSEARECLRAARAAEVGVYELAVPLETAVRKEFVEATTRAMNSRAWDRVVAVLDGNDSVVVFTPRDADPDAPLRVCVVVFDGHELVVASARVDVEPILHLALAEHRRGLVTGDL